MSWKDLVGKAADAAGGNKSFLWGCEMNEWHDLVIRPETVQTLDGKGDEPKWKKTVVVEMQTPTNDEWHDEEIPFWCKDDFFSELLDASDEDSIVEMKFKRSKRGDQNTGKFRL